MASRPLADAGDFAAWLDSLFDALGLEKPSLLGLSYGGWNFAQYALRRPDRVARLVLLAPAGTVAPINFAFIWRALLTLLPFGKGAMERFADWAAPGMASDPKWAEARQALIEDARRARRGSAPARPSSPCRAATAWATRRPPPPMRPAPSRPPRAR